MRAPTVLLLGLLGCTKQPEGPVHSVAPPPQRDQSTSGEAEAPTSPASPSSAASAALDSPGPPSSPSVGATGCPFGALTASLTHERTRSGAALVFLTDDDHLSFLRERVAAMSQAYPRDVAWPVEAGLDRIHDGIRLVVVPLQPRDAAAVRGEVQRRAAGLFVRCPHLRPPPRGSTEPGLAEARRPTPVTPDPEPDDEPDDDERVFVRGASDEERDLADDSESAPEPELDDEPTSATLDEPDDLPDFDDDIEPDEPENPEPGPNEPEPDEPEDPEPDPDQPEPDDPEDPEPDEPDEPDEPYDEANPGSPTS